MKKLNLDCVFKTPIIGVGAQGKSCLALGRAKSIYISEAGGDLTQADEVVKFEDKLENFTRIAGVRRFAHDLHPAYISTQLIYDYVRRRQNNCRLFGIAHHHAHIASAMAEHRLKGKVIGVAFDGTGLGLDGNFWGGDFFIATFNKFSRIAYLRYIPLIGGKEAILEPWRIACAWLDEIYEDKFLNLKIAFLKDIDKKKWQYLRKMKRCGLNSPLTSSVGRLFDAVSALLGLVKGKIAYEAEGPIKLEQAAGGFSHLNSKSRRFRYNYTVAKLAGTYIINPAQAIKEIVVDLEKAVEIGVISFKFHNTLATWIVDIATKIRRQTGLKRVVLSGGVFGNKLLSKLTLQMLKSEGFKVFEHKLFPPGDANISLGQIIIANAKRY